ncbi:MAG: TIGR01906 family membrane protein [Bacillota bacterium]|nr:TIGR01906 family membrane protein [Bacillota bacterium]
MVKSIQIFFSLILAVLVISIAAKISLNYRGIYYADIERLNISKTVNMENQVIRSNYNSIIDYLQGKSEKLNTPDFKMSQQGRSHFDDVRKLYKQIDKIFYISLIISLIGIAIFSIKRLFDYLKYSAWILIALPAVLSIFAFTNFNFIFTLFHKISFSNDLWLFDPAEDPIINILPEKYFMHQAVFILLIIFISALLMLLIYKIFKKRKNIILT